MSTSNQEAKQPQVQNQEAKQEQEQQQQVQNREQEEQEEQLTVVDTSIEDNSDNNNNKDEDDQTVTEEERQWMINDVKEKTKDLQNLLIKYRQMEDDLKEEVMEMVLRDIHEQNIHIGINKRVQTAQQEMLSDTAYVGWAMKHGKGEFAEKAAKKKTPEESKSTTSNDGNNSATSHSWKDNIVDAVASVALKKNKNQESDASTKEEKKTEENDAEIASLPDATILSSSLPLSTLVLPPRIALVLSSSFQALQDEESSMPELLKVRFHSFLTLVEVWKQRVEAHSNGEPCAICLNGIPLLLGNQNNLLSGDCKNALVSSSSSSSSSAASCEENVSSVINTWLERTNNTTTKEIIHDIFSTESDSSREFFNALLKHGTNSDELMPTSVAGSSNDTLSLIPLKQLQNSLLVYAVVSQKSSSSSQVQVAAIEPVVSSFALHLAKGFSTQSSIRQQVDTFCQQMIGPLMASKVIPKRCVLTLALSSSSSSSSSKNTTNNSTVVLDVAELNPHLPTSLLSWGDVCSILRQQQQPQNDFSSVLSSTTTNTGSSNFLFRGQKSRVANLEESIRNEKEEEEENGNEKNTTSTSSKTVARCFLQLVENCLNFDQDQDQDQDIKNAETKDQRDESSSSSSSVPLPVVGASVAAGIGLAAYFLLKKNNQSN